MWISISSYSERNAMSTPLFVDAITSAASARAKHWPQSAVLIPPRKSATYWVQNAEKSHTHYPQKRYPVDIDDKVKQLQVCNSWIKVSPRQDSHIYFSSTKQDFYSQRFRHWYFLKYPLSGKAECKSRVQESGHCKAYSAKNTHEQLDHNLQD